MRNLLPAGALVLLLSACGFGSNVNSQTKGAPHEFDAVCASGDGDTSFRIYEGQGLLQSVNFPGVSYSCARGGATATSDVLWACNERGTGTSQLEVRVRNGAKFVKVDGVGELPCL